MPTQATPKSVGVPLSALSAAAAATNNHNFLSKRKSYQPHINSAEVSLEGTAAGRTVNSNKKLSLLSRAELKAKQQKAGALLSAGKSRHFSPKRSSH